MPSKRQNFTGLTPTQKYDLCKLRQKYPKMKLSEFATLPDCPKRSDGSPLAGSSLSDHLKGWEEKIKVGPPTGPNSKKQKLRAAQFPFLEHFLSLWIDAAETERISVTDDIIRAQAKIVQELLKQAEVDEDYTEFELSAGWLAKFKSRYNIGRMKNYGDAPIIDQSFVPIWRRELAERLAPFVPDDRYNCDESGLVYNKQPRTSNIHKEKGKLVAVGGKDDKLRISTFHIVNSTGNDKRKLWVISHATEPQAFRRNHINPANLPIVYRSNKKAWMITALWFEFLRSLNIQMRIERRHIALVADNCPSHPDPRHPPISWTGPTPPELTNITLIFLPPNTTSVLQPLDQGIIRSFKAAYRRHYADNMVQHFNCHGKRLEKIDILQAIYLIADAWDSVTQETIVRCWKKANICGDIDLPGPSNSPNLNLEDEYQHFIAREHNYCQVAIRQLFVEDPLAQPDSNFVSEFDEYFHFDEDNIREESERAELPDISSIVARGISAGALLVAPDMLNDFEIPVESEAICNQSESERAEASILESSPIITIDVAIHYADELSRYLQSMRVTELYTPAGKELSVSDLTVNTLQLRNALLRQRNTFKNTQTKISSFFQLQTAQGIVSCARASMMETNGYGDLELERTDCISTVWRNLPVNSAEDSGVGGEEWGQTYRRLLQ